MIAIEGYELANDFDFDYEIEIRHTCIIFYSNKWRYYILRVLPFMLPFRKRSLKCISDMQVIRLINSNLEKIQKI